MSPTSVRQPGDVVNEIYSQNIKLIIDMCFEAGDDPTPIIEETKHELQVKRKFEFSVKTKRILII